MKKFLTIIALCILSASNAQNNIGCFREGACVNSFELGRSLVATAEECLRDCNAVAACSEWTYFDTSKDCALFSSCNAFSDSACSDCVSGDKGCADLQCFMEGRCTGTTIGATMTNVPTWRNCNALCEEDKSCNWFTYDIDPETGLTCTLYSNCLTIQSCTSCVSSQKFCGSIFYKIHMCVPSE